MNKLAVPHIIDSIEQARDISPERLPALVSPSRVLMCEPRYFDVVDAKNEFMVGQAGSVDRELALEQWQDVRNTFEMLGYPVSLIEPQPDFEDMVFCANQVLPGQDEDGSSFALLAEMMHESRRREVPFFQRWFAAQGYKILTLPQSGSVTPRFEGQGDAIWHPGRKLLWIGYGQRTEENACPLVARTLQVPVIKLKLVSSKFYHLDTAFSALSDDTVMIYPGAFNQAGLKLIRRFFGRVVEVPEEDACNFACNAVGLGRHVLLQKGSRETVRLLKGLGFDPIELDTSEFMKSGGSVFCMKMMVY